MEQQASHWITLSFVLLAGAVVLVRNRRVTNERRSLGQWLIFRFYKAVRFFWAVGRGIDVGYLEYRQVLSRALLEMENEKVLGKLVKESEAQSGLGRALAWAPEEN